MPSAIVVIAAACTTRLTKFPAVRKFAFCVWKTIAMMISPRTIGSEPRSPERTPDHHSRATASTDCSPDGLAPTAGVGGVGAGVGATVLMG